MNHAVWLVLIPKSGISSNGNAVKCTCSSFSGIFIDFIGKDGGHLTRKMDVLGRILIL